MAGHFDPSEARDDHGRWTNGQTRAWLAKHPVDSKHIIAMYDQATEGEKATGKDWYPNAHKIAVAMSKAYGITPRQAAGVIAAYSPQTPWGKNLMEASEVLRTHTAIGGKGAHLDIVKTPNDTQESRYGVMASGVNHKRAQALLSGADFENVFGGKRNKNGSLPPSSLKVRSFAELIAKGGQTDPHRTKVVIDRHAAGVARGVRLTERDYAIEGPSSSHKKYAAYADAYREAAALLSKREGRTVTPEEVQATTWLARQRLNNTEAPNGREALGDRDASESLNYFASYEPNIADVIGHPMTGYANLAAEPRGDIDLHYNPAERRDSHGRWTKGGVGPRLHTVLKGHNVRGQFLNGGTAKSPINVRGNVMLGAKLVAQGKHIRLNKVDQVGTLLTDLLKLSKEAKRKHETLDLCRVSIPKTNLFCAQSRGIDRIHMPQLAGVPKPGSKGALYQDEPGAEVDLTAQFETALRSHGVKVTDTTLPAASFKATQDQLVGDKVAGIEKFMETAPKDSRVFEPIFVTRDHYIIDGHHRWAAMVGLDAKDGVLGNFPMAVRVVDMDIGEALAAARAFAADWGIAPEGAVNTGPTIAKFHQKLDLSTSVADVEKAIGGFNPAEPRDSHGRWTRLGGLKGMDLTRHLRALPVGSHVQLGEKMLYSKHHGGFYQKGAAEVPISPEALASVLNGSDKAKSRVPKDYIGPKAEMLNIAETLKAPVLGETGGLRSRLSDVAAGHPDLLDDSEVRQALTSGDTGMHRLVTAHDFQRSQTPEGKASSDALASAMFEARAKQAAKLEAKRRQAEWLSKLNDLVSDYEFYSAITGDANPDDIKQLLHEHPGLLKTAKGKALLGEHPELTGKPPTYAQAAKDYEWNSMDIQGSFPGDKASVHMEHEAQITSEFWHDTLPPDAPAVDQYAKNLWETYQNPQGYGDINTMLRTGKKTPDSNATVGNLRRYVAKMFEDAGTTLDKPMTLYRAIRSSDQPGHNWAEVFKPGTTFTDKGIMSCTAHGRFAQGWLNNDPVGNEMDNAKPNDVVLEIRTPAGQRIVGGSKQFIETMLPPNTPLRIISNEQRTADNPVNPLGALNEDPFVYTHVVAEVVPNVRPASSHATHRRRKRA